MSIYYLSQQGIASSRPLRRLTPDEISTRPWLAPFQLKERRREMVAALQSGIDPIRDDELQKIAAIQQTISAFEDVIADRDAEGFDRAA
jgi:hypothetical protein